jgi:hypothetical protein
MSDETSGSCAEQPIVLKPLESPCKEERTLVLANLIADAYKWYQEKNVWDEAPNEQADEPRLKLPDGVEFDDALVVLDYYGFNMDESVKFNFDKMADVIHILAKLFLKWWHSMGKARQFIIEYLKKSPQKKTLFLFATKSHGAYQ